MNECGLFTGQRFDGTIGLYQMGARWYDPALGRFISADTIIPNFANAQSLNRYAYAYNRPLVCVDTSGNCPWCIGAVLGGLVGGGLEYVKQARANRNSGMSWGEAIKPDNIDLGKVAGGAVGGAIAGGTMGIGTAMGFGVVGTMALGGIGGVLGGQASALTESGVNELIQWASGQGGSYDGLIEGAFNAGLLDRKTVLYDLAAGAFVAGIGYKLSAVIEPILARYGDYVAEGFLPYVGLQPATGEEGIKAYLILKGQQVVLERSQLENILKAAAAGSWDIVSEILQQIVEGVVTQQPQEGTAPATP